MVHIKRQPRFGKKLIPAAAQVRDEEALGIRRVVGVALQDRGIGTASLLVQIEAVVTEDHGVEAVAAVTDEDFLLRDGQSLPDMDVVGIVAVQAVRGADVDLVPAVFDDLTAADGPEAGPLDVPEGGPAHFPAAADRHDDLRPALLMVRVGLHSSYMDAGTRENT